MQRIGGLKSVTEFQEYLSRLGLQLPCDPVPLSASEQSPLVEPLEVDGFRVGNRWCVHPMEGWDGTPDGRPSEHTFRRWEHFGESGCKLIWGGEAVAVRLEGRANPLQLTHTPHTREEFSRLRERLVLAHQQRFGVGAEADLLLGLQLTHSGRFCKPFEKTKFAPRIAYHHSVLDRRVGLPANDSSAVLSDAEIRSIIDDYVAAARTAAAAGFQFVDVKACHGYLLHEFLSARTRPGTYGGDLQGRSRMLREIIAAVQAECPGLLIGVRLSLFDVCPYRPDPGKSVGNKLGPGIPEPAPDFVPFGASPHDVTQLDLTEPLQLLRLLSEELGVTFFNLSAGSPYYNPHIQRPAYYPPSDGYQPPEDPLIGCVRQIQAVREVKRQLPHLTLVGTAYTYLQEFLPHVAQAVIRAGWVDSVGIGRLVLSDWDLPAKVLQGKDYKASRKICRTFSDCTTAPRKGLISGCYPLDPYYKELPEFEQLKAAKKS